MNNYDKEGNEINPNEIKITDLVIYEIVKKYEKSKELMKQMKNLIILPQWKKVKPDFSHLT